MEWYERFYSKERWIKKSAEIEGKLYDRLKEISKKELDGSINKIIDACVDDLKLEDNEATEYAIKTGLEKYDDK